MEISWYKDTVVAFSICCDVGAMGTGLKKVEGKVCVVCVVMGVMVTVCVGAGFV